MSRTRRANKNSLNWADDVEAQDVSSHQEVKQHKTSSSNDWHASMNVERGTSRHRLNLNHGFVKQVIRNQHDRDQYEQQWQAAYEQAGEYGKKWGRVKVPPQPKHHVPSTAQQSSQLADGVVEGIPVPGYPVVVGNTQYVTYGMHPYAVLHQANEPAMAQQPAALPSPRRAPRVRLGYAAYKPPAALGKKCSLDPSEVATIEARGPRLLNHDMRSNEAQLAEVGSPPPSAIEAEGSSSPAVAAELSLLVTDQPRVDESMHVEGQELSPPPGLTTPRPPDLPAQASTDAKPRKNRRSGRRRKAALATDSAVQEEDLSAQTTKPPTQSTVKTVPAEPNYQAACQEVVVVVVRPYWSESVSCAMSVVADGHVSTVLESRRCRDLSQPVRVMLLVRDAQRVAATAAPKPGRLVRRGVAGVYQPPKRSTLQDLKIVPVGVKLVVDDDGCVAVQMCPARTYSYN